MTTTAPTTTTPRRRWLQFSLRTLLVVMLALGCGFGWLAHKVHQAKVQRKAAAAIEALGGSVGYRVEVDGTGPAGSAWLERLLGERSSGDLVDVDLTHVPITDAGLEHVRKLTRLRHLNLDGTQVTDAGLASLRGLTELTSLSLDDTRVTGAGLIRLRGLPQLQQLFLRRTQVTDAGLTQLRCLTQLRWLDLSNTPVTDRGMLHLQELRQLRWVFLSNTRSRTQD